MSERGSRSKKLNPKIRVDFVLPIKTTEGGGANINHICSEIVSLLKEHGGVTISGLSQGFWINSETGKPEGDKNVSFHVVMSKDARDSLILGYLPNLRKRLEADFGEKQIYITYHDVDVV